MTTISSISSSDRLLPTEVVSKVSKYIQSEKRFLKTATDFNPLYSARSFLALLLTDLELEGKSLTYNQAHEAVLDLCYELNLDVADFEELLEVSNLQVVETNSSNAGELAQSSEDSPVALLPAATHSQTLLDGVYDVVASGVAKVKAKFSKRVDDSSPSVQITLFELLRPFAKAQYEKMQALFRLYSKDLQDLKNPLSRLSKILGRKRESKLDALGKQVGVMARDLTAYGLMWELL